ncbi:MAG: hypothetical protein ACOYO9_13030 [Candidatus Nanopelagicales bacterium]
MTHDELIQKIIAVNTASHESALLAVVELHKPESDRMPFCVVCRGVWQGEIDVVVYPCPTIKAIEKELG